MKAITKKAEELTEKFFLLWEEWGWMLIAGIVLIVLFGLMFIFTRK